MDTTEITANESPEIKPGSAVSFSARIRLASVWMSLFILSLAAGLEAGLIQYFIRRGASRISLLWTDNADLSNILQVSAILAGIGMAILIGLVILVPIAWRRVRGITSQRAIVYATIQFFGIAIGLFGLNSWFSFTLTSLTVFVGTRIWWHWERRWRGVGVSPSLRSGIWRPAIHPGQIWFAFIPGEQATKNRPVMTLHAKENGRWLVAYYTSRPPKYEAQKKYFVEVKAETVRGMEKDSWINISDVRSLKRNQFRTYIGLAPQALYEEICTLAGVTCDPDSWTIAETVAGGSFGPIESEFRRILGLSHNESSRMGAENPKEILKDFWHWVIH